jgi:uncharacterized protein Yka (UPF0111/DUF47 family)
LTDKTEIIDAIGAHELLLPRMISDALIANDRAKYFLALLQNARAHADSPDLEVSDLRSERLSSGVSDESLDQVTRSTYRIQDGNYHIPEVERIFDGAVSCIEEMMKPLQLADTDRKAAYERYRARLVAIKASSAGLQDESASESFIDAMTSGRPGSRDSLHLIVMDLHREMNTLQSAVYQESVEGASVYGIGESDRVLVLAFMKGVNQTAKLKFDHPGLGTTATRAGDVLMIQNDLGETEAHVVVIKVKENAVSITYTDVHKQRLHFFQSMLEKFGVSWTDTVSRENKNLKDSGGYYLSTGVYRAKVTGDLEAFLTFFGSRLVFLIDWNRARKQLRLFLTKGDSFETLKWAADNNRGHMGFLKMGGDKLVLGAIEQSAKAPLRFGDQFYDVLGRKRASEFLKFVLATCSDGLLQNKSEVLIRDEVRAELAESLHSVNEDLLDIAARHSSLVVELATAVRDGLVRIGSDDREFLKRTAERGRKWESEADTLLNKVRLEVKRSNAPVAFEEMLSHSDDAADSLEDSLFLLTLAAWGHVRGPLSGPLLDLAEIAARASAEYLKAIEDAKAIRRWSPREDMEDFLEAVDKVMTLEHDADDALREVKEVLAANASDFKQMQAVTEISKDIEQSTDALMKSAITLKDYMLKEIVGA